MSERLDRVGSVSLGIGVDSIGSGAVAEAVSAFGGRGVVRVEEIDRHDPRDFTQEGWEDERGTTPRAERIEKRTRGGSEQIGPEGADAKTARMGASRVRHDFMITCNVANRHKDKSTRS